MRPEAFSTQTLLKKFMGHQLSKCLFIVMGSDPKGPDPEIGSKRIGGLGAGFGEGPVIPAE